MLFLRSPNMNLWYGLKYIYIYLSLYLYIYILYSPSADVITMYIYTHICIYLSNYIYILAIFPICRYNYDRSPITKPSDFWRRWGDKSCDGGQKQRQRQVFQPRLVKRRGTRGFWVIFSMGNPWKSTTGWLNSMVYARYNCIIHGVYKLTDNWI